MPFYAIMKGTDCGLETDETDIRFAYKIGKDKYLTFLDISAHRSNSFLTTSVHRNSTFSGAYTS